MSSFAQMQDFLIPPANGHGAATLDKYYTKDHVVDRCLRLIQRDLKMCDLVIDPSAGDGAFLNRIPHKNKIGMDVAPDADNIRRGDWLRYFVPRGYQKVAVTGNPPFGTNHALSQAFIRHALSFANVSLIAFILPDVYKKHTRQRILPKEWRIRLVSDTGKNAFVFEGRERNMPCSFFVFDKSPGVDLRFRPEDHAEAVDFSWGCPDDFDIFMFGAAPRKLTRCPTPNNRGYYLRAKIPVPQLERRLREMCWTGNSAASGGVYWLTKPEIVAQYNACHKRK